MSTKNYKKLLVCGFLLLVMSVGFQKTTPQNPALQKPSSNDTTVKTAASEVGVWQLGTVGRKNSGEYSSTGLSLSSDGRFLVFQSNADNLVASDSNQVTDIFLLDLSDNSIRLVSTGLNGAQSNGASTQPWISANGQFVAFRSVAENLVANDDNATADIFVHDLTTGINQLVSLSNSGLQIDIESRNPSISGDGQRVAFETRGSTVVPGDVNAAVDVFVRDIKQKKTYAVTAGKSVGESSVDRVNQDSGEAQISQDGKLVVFQSFSPYLVSGDNNGVADIFEAEIDSGLITRISEQDGVGGDADSLSPSISANERYISFSSSASNLGEANPDSELQVFVNDRIYRTTVLSSVSETGGVGNGPSFRSKVAINGDVVFISYSNNLTDSGWDGGPKVFRSQNRDGVRRVDSILTADSDIALESVSYSLEIDRLAEEIVFIGSQIMQNKGPSVYRANYGI